MIALAQEIALLFIPMKSIITSAAMSPISAMNSRLPSLLQNCGFRTAKNVIVAIINVAARNASVTTSESSPPYSCTATEITNPLGSTIRLYPTNPATGFVDTADIIHPTITQTRFCTVDGVVYTKDKKVLIKYPNRRDGHYDVPEGTEYILYNAFAGSKIESVKFPESLFRIGTYAFSDCRQLTDIKFNHTIDDYSRFGDMGQFYGCRGLKELEIPSWIKVLSSMMFSCCNLKKVVLHEGLEIIGDTTFNDIAADTLTVPRTLKTVKANNFGRFIKELHVYDRAPEGILLSVLNAYNDTSTYNKIGLTFKLIVTEDDKDYTFYFPKTLPKEVISQLDECFRMFSPKAADIDWIDSLYALCFSNALVQDTAFELYDITKKDIYRNALKRSRQSIVKRYFNEGKEEKLVKFFQLGFFAKSSLEKFLKLAHENNMNALAAYILTEIEKKAPKNASKKLQL